MAEYTINQGDCLLSIAAENGLLWETIWNHPNNAALKQRSHGDSNVLLPGDVIYIPEKTLRVEDKPTDQRHKFVRKGIRAKVRLRLLDWKRQPRPNVRYSAVVDGAISSGTTDSGGYITLKAPPTARDLKLTVSQGQRTEEYTLPLGSIDPIDSLAGVQQRLSNLGYPCGSEMGTLGEATRNSLKGFQKERNLPETGDLDDATRQQLMQMHGC
jgi:hypothetical protein